ncbi:MAG: DsbC family protein [Nitrosomonas sp.]|nr:MAG: DsbC family protein [Nitrosomonas sp.]
MTSHFKLFILLLAFCLASSTVWANETIVRNAVQIQFPEHNIDSLKKISALGLYEVVLGEDVFYVDEKAEYFFFGHLVDAKTKNSLTNDRIQEIKAARRIPLTTLPLQHAIKVIKGDGSRQLAIYTDPNCPYCKRLEKELLSIDNITIYTLLYPVLNGSMELSKKIWCSDNQIKAWDDFMLRGIAPADKACDTPLDVLVKSGRENRVTGTPTLIFADGSIVGGLIPAATIEEKLKSAIQAK